MLTFFFLLWIILNGRVTLELVLLGIPIAAAVFLFARREIFGLFRFLSFFKNFFLLQEQFSSLTLF